MIVWVWDAKKNQINRRRHGLSLDTGIIALLDPLSMSAIDPHSDGNRMNTVGRAGGHVILFVVHTASERTDEGGETGRIISVRKATKRERKAYEEGNH